MADAAQPPKDLIGFLDFYLVHKAPFQLPDNLKEWIVKFGPWICVVLLVISLPAVLIVFGLGAVFLPFATVSYGTGFGLAWLLLLVHLVLMVMALPGLFARKISGWRLLFYAEIASVLSSLFNYAIVGAIVGGLIGMYILFQVRSKYQV